MKTGKHSRMSKSGANASAGWLFRAALAEEKQRRRAAERRAAALEKGAASRTAPPPPGRLRRPKAKRWTGPKTGSSAESDPKITERIHDLPALGNRGLGQL